MKFQKKINVNVRGGVEEVPLASTSRASSQANETSSCEEFRIRHRVLVQVDCPPTSNNNAIYGSTFVSTQLFHNGT